jgi:hypothetical protein
MAVLKVRRYGDPVLRTKAKPVGEITPEIRAMVDDMIETMYEEVGIGLAASQVGILLRPHGRGRRGRRPGARSSIPSSRRAGAR